MRKVYIDSCLHYQIKEDQGKLFLLEYGTGDPDSEDYDSCPGMDHRGPFKASEGRVIEEFAEGEQVEFVYSSYKTKMTASLVTEPVCGDDLRYLFTTKEPRKLAAGSRIEHTKFGKGTVVGPFSEPPQSHLDGRVTCWAVLFDDETAANEHLKAINLPPLTGKPFPIVPGLEPDSITDITNE